MLKKLIYFWVVVCPMSLLAQDHLVSGQVVDEEAKGLSGVNIISLEYGFGTATDDLGYFEFKLPYGSHTLSLTSVGKEPLKKQMRIWKDVQLLFKMKPLIIEMNVYIKTGRSDDYRMKGAPGIERMSMAVLQELPSLMGEVDLINAIHLLPGVSTIGEGASGFNVRGGKTDQNLITFNGGEVFNSSHLLGFFSIFNSDVIEDFTLFKGYIPANYGGRISSVLDVNLKEGDYQLWGGGVSTGLISSKVFFEGPIIENKLSIIGAARVAYPDWMMHKIPNQEVRQSQGLFNDVNMSVGYRFNQRNKIVFSLYNSYDKFRYSNDFDFRWNTFLSNLKLQNSINDDLLHELELSHVNYQTSQIDLIKDFEIQGGISYTSFHDSFIFYGFENHELQAGIEIKRYEQIPEERIPGLTSVFSSESVKKSQVFISSMYMNDDWTLGPNLSVSLGLRFNHYAQFNQALEYSYLEGYPIDVETMVDSISREGVSQSYMNLEPRLGLNFSLNNQWSLKASFNNLSQYMHLISNAASPTPVDIWQVSTRYIKPQRSYNYSLGAIYQGKEKNWQHSFDVYYRDITRIYEYKDFAELVLNNHLETELVESRGRAYGLELLIEKNSFGWNGWMSYTLSKTENQVTSPFEEDQINNGDWFPANYDQRHNFSITLQKQMGRNGFFSINGVYKSGRPFTAVETNYSFQGIGVPIYSKRNGYHIPNYFRVDVGIGLKSLLPKFEDRLTLSFYNFFGRANAYSIFYQRPSANAIFTQSYQLSILGNMFPSVTYAINFRQKELDY